MNDEMIQISKESLNKLYKEKYSAEAKCNNLEKDKNTYKKIAFSLGIAYLLLFITVVISYG